jgi:TfoX/Sxy family transcriptional regulator of competence genes
MAYDEQLATAIRAIVGDEPGLYEKKMFGGVAFLVHGNMAVAAGSDGNLMLRIDPADSDRLTADPHAERMEMRGRAMDGWLRVDRAVLDDAAVLGGWVDIGLAHARSLPPK